MLWFRRRPPTPLQLAVTRICELYPSKEGYGNLWTIWQTPTGKRQSWYRRYHKSERERGWFDRCLRGIWLLKEEFLALDERWFSAEVIEGLEEYHILKVLGKDQKEVHHGGE